MFRPPLFCFSRVLHPPQRQAERKDVSRLWMASREVSLWTSKLDAYAIHQNTPAQWEGGPHFQPPASPSTFPGPAFFETN